MGVDNLEALQFWILIFKKRKKRRSMNNIKLSGTIMGQLWGKRYKIQAIYVAVTRIAELN